MFTTDYLEATLIRGFEIPKVLLQKMTSLTNKLNVWSWNKSPFPSICIHLQKVLVISCKPIDLVYGMEKTITFQRQCGFAVLFGLVQKVSVMKSKFVVGNIHHAYLSVI